MKSTDILRIATNELGTKESPPNSNNVKYNTWYYGKAVNGSAYPWCCAFISWLFKGTNLVKKTASCQDLLTWFEQNGQTVKTPKVGDIVFFKYSTNNRRTNHVGLVVGVSAGSIQTIEGNTSLTSNDNGGAVMQRTRKSNIVAYARPKYEPVTVKLSDDQITEIALQVINGKWGTGEIRKSRLRAEGYDYTEIQKRVNEILRR